MALRERSESAMAFLQGEFPGATSPKGQLRTRGPFSGGSLPYRRPFGPHVPKRPTRPANLLLEYVL